MKIDSYQDVSLRDGRAKTKLIKLKISMHTIVDEGKKPQFILHNGISHPFQSFSDCSSKSVNK